MLRILGPTGNPQANNLFAILASEPHAGLTLPALPQPSRVDNREEGYPIYVKHW